MDNLDNLKAIWHTAKTDSLPSSKEMLQIIRKFRSQKLRHKWLVIVCSCLLSLLIVAILFTVHFHLASTYIGGMLMAASGFLLAATNIRSLKRFYYQLEDCSNLELLNFIEQTRQNQIFYYKKTQVIIIVLCAAGLLLYLYELTIRHPTWLIGIYLVNIGYFSIMWFIVRPHYFKKGQEKLNATRQRLEKISNQLK